MSESSQSSRPGKSTHAGPTDRHQKGGERVFGAMVFQSATQRRKKGTNRSAEVHPRKTAIKAKREGWRLTCSFGTNQTETGESSQSSRPGDTTQSSPLKIKQNRSNQNRGGNIQGNFGLEISPTRLRRSSDFADRRKCLPVRKSA